MAAARVIDASPLPAQLAASEPPEARGLRRDAVRLLVSHLDSDSLSHTRFDELPQWLRPGDLLVVNTSGTLKAAVGAQSVDGDRLEVHFSTRLPGNFWVVEVRRPGVVASLPDHEGRAGATLEVDGTGRLFLLAPYPLRNGVDGRSRLWLAAVQLHEPIEQYLEKFGAPIRYGYVKDAWPSSMYQTIFVTEPGSAEMPSAGRPFTPELVTRLISRGVQIAPLLLHTGVASLEDQEPPYEEYFRVTRDTADLVNSAKHAGRRVIAVGTTVVRALETVTDAHGKISPGQGWTNLVISRDQTLRSVTGMITGFHEPRATHLAIVEQVIAAAGGRDPAAHLERVYQEARSVGYLWHEFGDSHLILG